MIFKGSRYSDGAVYYDEDRDVDYLAPVDTVINGDERDYNYIFKAGDRLDILADRFYGNPQLKWLILYANPQLNSEFDLSEGDVLIIPFPDREDVK